MGAWFMHFDPYGRGMDPEVMMLYRLLHCNMSCLMIPFQELMRALTQSLRLTDSSAASVRSSLYELWPLFDTDRSGRITLNEFVVRGGLGETIVAQVQHLSRPTDPFEAQIASVLAILPGTPRQAALDALKKTNGDVSAAVDLLMRPPAALPAPAAQPAAGPQQFSCGSCRTLFQINLAQIPAGIPTVQANCPTCGRSNQISVPPRPAAVSSLPAAVGAPHSVFVHGAPGGPAPAGSVGYRPSAGLMCTRAPPRSYLGGARGEKKALLIGINYVGQRAQLRGCANDVANVYRLLTVTYGWSAQSMRILTDDVSTDRQSYACSCGSPTRANILDALRWLTASVKPGDSLFFLYSGHGAQQEDPNGYEEDGMNETILPG
jgi:hypothetical protein